MMCWRWGTISQRRWVKNLLNLLILTSYTVNRLVVLSETVECTADKYLNIIIFVDDPIFLL